MNINDIKVGKKYYWNNHNDNIAVGKVVLIIDGKIVVKCSGAFRRVSPSSIIAKRPNLLSRIIKYWI